MSNWNLKKLNFQFSFFTADKSVEFHSFLHNSCRRKMASKKHILLFVNLYLIDNHIDSSSANNHSSQVVILIENDSTIAQLAEAIAEEYQQLPQNKLNHKSITVSSICKRLSF